MPTHKDKKQVDLKTNSVTVLLLLSIFFTPFVYSDNFAGSDSFFGTESLMSHPFDRNGVIWDTPEKCISLMQAPSVQYKQYHFNIDAIGELTVNFNPQSCANNIYVTFHTEPFDPNDICLNHVWSFGSSVAFNETFTVPPSTPMTMVVSGGTQTNNVNCGPFTWNLSGVVSTDDNLWAKSLRVKNSKKPNADSWQASFIYNSDRRTGEVFNPLADGFTAALGGSKIDIPAGGPPNGFTVSSKGDFSYKSPKGMTPVVNIKGFPSKQTLNVKISSTEIVENFASSPIIVSVKMGEDTKNINALFIKNKFVPTSSYLNNSFVVVSNKLNNLNSPDGSLKAKLNLASTDLFPSFNFNNCKNCKNPPVILRIYDNSSLILTKDLTQLLFATKKVRGNGQTVYSIKKLGKDIATENVLSSFSYSSAKGGLNLGLSKLAFSSPLTASQAQLDIEIEIDGKTYATSVTMFANDTLNNGYSSSYTKISSPL